MLCAFRGALGTRLIIIIIRTFVTRAVSANILNPRRRQVTRSNAMWPVRRSTSLRSGVFIHPAVWPQQCRMRRNISTTYYFVVEMLTVTVRSDDARHLLKIQLTA